MDVKSLCLGVLALGDASGYEIKKQLEEGPLAYFYRAGYGSIYPALNKLSEEGLVTFTEMSQEGRPGKKVYSITERGQAAFRKALRKKPGPDKIRSESMFMLFFAEFLEPERRRDVYEEYLSRFHSIIECMETVDLSEEMPGRRFAHELGLALYRSIADFMEANRDIVLEGDPGAAVAAE